MSPVNAVRRLSMGAEIQPGGGVHARVWAPRCQQVDFVLEHHTGRQITPLERESDGFFAGTIDAARPGDRYWYRLDGERLRPDPASRFQPDGPHGPSMIVDPTVFAWSDANFPGIGPRHNIVYEMHVGTFTREGTWRAAAEQLDALADLGVTVIEMMPVADFAGRFGWGYDGVNMYAPTRLYGTPDDLRAFIDRAHARGIGVILDVVYNHFGPDGNYIGEFSTDYFSKKYTNDWGDALNFEGPRQVRDFFVENAGYWVDEYHFDGLRLDATQDIKDASASHIIHDVIERTRHAAGRRSVYVVCENEPQETRIVRDPAAGGYGADAVWNDDFHHTAVVALTGRREAYYTDYRGTPQEMVSAARFGYLYQGQWYAWQKKRRGTSALDLPGYKFVVYLENHDQVANTAFGKRLHAVASPGRLRALTAFMLLGPATPLLFQGQEFASSAPFMYFADHKLELREPVRTGRREFLSQFPSIRDPETLAALPSPVDEQTFVTCKLDQSERARHAEAVTFHRDLIRLRQNDPVLRDACERRPDGAVIGPGAFLLRYAGGEDGDRLLIVNLGCDVELTPAPEPLLAPPLGSHWELLWSSESPRYGGSGTPPLRPHAQLALPGESAVLLRSRQGDAEDETSHTDVGKHDDEQ